MGMTDGLAREAIPEEIEDHLGKIEEQATSLSGLFEGYGLQTSEAPIYIALDEIRDAIQTAIEED